ncbi:MAG TPA: phospho-N-acetylmuramoyl-pentapeptide-transferase [Candidatus Obscuribacterales bacterium]
MNPLNLTALVSLVISAAFFSPYIKWLKYKQIEQFIREEGPQSHAAKAKTPTMGGLCFAVIAVVIAAVYIFAVRQPSGPIIGGQMAGETAQWETFASLLDIASWPAARAAALSVIAIALACGFIGFADDYGKITSRSNRGLPAKLRLAIEFGLGLVLSGLLVVAHAAPTFLVGFGGIINLDATWQLIYLVVIVPLLVASTTNAVNLHDGMDGLAAGTSVLIFSVLFFITISLGGLYLAAICAAMVGAVTGFLIYNRYPASVFMGDTGSLFIGGMIAAVVAASGLVLWFIPLALLYVAEAASVIIQVTYFKLTKEYTPPTPMSRPALIWRKLTTRLPGDGKRFFRMAPLHHHFEAIGQERGEPEWKVVAYFWVVQFLLCAVTWLVFNRAFPLS